MRYMNFFRHSKLLLQDWPTPCSVAEDSMKIDAQIIVEKNKDDGLTSCKDKDEVLDEHHHHHHQKTKFKSSLDLFRKYLKAKNPHNLGKTNEEESDAIRRAPLRPLVPPKVYGGFRPPSLLELALLPGISRDSTLPTSSDDRSTTSTSQLTIFYGGEINVYDDVPFDKAQAIMLLAGKTSAPVVGSIPKTDVKKPLQQPNVPSICTLQADLPIARKYSLQRFLEKRRDRITNKSPYASSNTRLEKDEQSTGTIDLNGKAGNFTPSPFPSRLGYSFPVLTSKGC